MDLAAETIGCDAAAALKPGAAGVVAATFARSAYVRFGGEWVCFGSVEIGSGPLNVPCHTDAGCDWRSLTEPGLGALIIADSLSLGPACRINLATARPWSPPDAAWRPAALPQALHRLSRILPSDLPDEGLSRLIAPNGGSASAVECFALPAIRVIESWIQRGSAGQAELREAVNRLIGLGPGLTPSGDDFLAGMLVALRCADHPHLADELWRAIEAQGADATTSISFAHLRSAVGGKLGEDLHQALCALLEGNPAQLERALGRLKSKTNNSPWDGLAGICTALRAVAATPAESGSVLQVLQKVGGHGAGHAAALSMSFLCSLRSSMLR